MKQRLGHGFCLHGIVGGISKRLVTSLEGESTQYKPLKVDLRCYKTGCTGGTMLFRNVPGSQHDLERVLYLMVLFLLGLVQLKGCLTDDH